MKCFECQQPIDETTGVCPLCEALTVFDEGKIEEKTETEGETVEEDSGAEKAAEEETDNPPPVDPELVLPPIQRKNPLLLYLSIAVAVGVAIWLAVLAGDREPSRFRNERISVATTGELTTLFRRVREATLQRDIDLFMSCYSADFPNREQKRSQTLALWDKHRFINLSFDMSDMRMGGDLLHSVITWDIELQELPDGEPRQISTTNNVTLEKDRNRWRIIALN
ncbi:MAG: hypothetical protein C0616_02745 [Desulfuromonas sp.]|nr:MAG: hypothetical protein C0616_02745 [Desulfuromonas sp.]